MLSCGADFRRGLKPNATYFASGRQFCTNWACGQSCPQPPFRRLFGPSESVRVPKEPAESRLQPRLAAPTLEEAIRKFTALPAGRMRFADRGVLKAGMWADVVVFDPDTIRDVATFGNPNQLSEGMQFVLVNGVSVIDGGKMTNALPGKVVLR